MLNAVNGLNGFVLRTKRRLILVLVHFEWTLAF